MTNDRVKKQLPANPQLSTIDLHDQQSLPLARDIEPSCDKIPSGASDAAFTANPDSTSRPVEHRPSCDMPHTPRADRASSRTAMATLYNDAPKRNKAPRRSPSCPPNSTVTVAARSTASSSSAQTGRTNFHLHSRPALQSRIGSSRRSTRAAVAATSAMRYAFYVLEHKNRPLERTCAGVDHLPRLGFLIVRSAAVRTSNSSRVDYLDSIRSDPL